MATKETVEKELERIAHMIDADGIAQAHADHTADAVLSTATSDLQEACAVRGDFKLDVNKRKGDKVATVLQYAGANPQPVMVINLHWSGSQVVVWAEESPKSQIIPTNKHHAALPNEVDQAWMRNVLAQILSEARSR